VADDYHGACRARLLADKVEEVARGRRVYSWVEGDWWPQAKLCLRKLPCLAGPARRGAQDMIGSQAGQAKPPADGGGVASPPRA
jgi:hypothetical protein